MKMKILILRDKRTGEVSEEWLNPFTSHLNPKLVGEESKNFEVIGTKEI